MAYFRIIEASKRGSILQILLYYSDSWNTTDFYMLGCIFPMQEENFKSTATGMSKVNQKVEKDAFYRPLILRNPQLSGMHLNAERVVVPAKEFLWI